jgi:hypothetical protein
MRDIRTKKNMTGELYSLVYTDIQKVFFTLYYKLLL